MLRHEPTELYQVSVDPTGIRGVGLEREVPLERLPRVRFVLLFVVQKTELAERVSEGSIELGGALVCLEGLSEERRLLRERPPPGLEVVQVAVEEVCDRISRCQRERAVEPLLGDLEAAGLDVEQRVVAQEAGFSFERRAKCRREVVTGESPDGGWMRHLPVRLLQAPSAPRVPLTTREAASDRDADGPSPSPRTPTSSDPPAQTMRQTTCQRRGSIVSP